MERDRTAGDVAALLGRPLCVACRKCGHRSAFRATSREAREPAVDGRLVCSRCGGRDVKVVRASDDRDAARWLADR